MAALTLLCAVSCKDALVEKPYAVATATFFNTGDECLTALRSPFGAMRAVYDMNITGVLELSTELLIGRASWVELSNFEKMSSTNVTRAADIWNNYYKAIRDANVAIKAIPGASNMSDALKTSYLAQFRFVRGWSYYVLASHYGKAVLRTEENQNVWDLPMSDAEAVFSYAIEDLKFASQNAPDKAQELGLPDKEMGYAALSMACLAAKKYGEAKTAAEHVIKSNKYKLVEVNAPRDFEKIFDSSVHSSTEEIFYIKTSLTNNTGRKSAVLLATPNASVNGRRILNGKGYNGVYALSANPYVSGWDDNDFRKAFNLLEISDPANTYAPIDPFSLYGITKSSPDEKFYIPAKFTCYDAVDNVTPNDMPLIRIADIYLVYAEAAAKAAGAPNADAIEHLNVIRRRAYGKPLNTPDATVDYALADYNTMDKFMEAVCNEDMYEHVSEMKHYAFLIRTGMLDARVKNGPGFTVDPSRHLLPIPQGEFNYNKGVDASKDQNPGY